MRSLILVAATFIGGAVYATQMADRVTPARANTPQPSASLASAGTRMTTVPRAASGHFEAEMRVDGQRLPVLIDTGASLIALNESSAARVGIRPRASDYTSLARTANGTIKAAKARIARIEIGEVVVHDIEAMVLPDTALSENLLGMSFLSKLKRFEFAGTKLVMEQ